MVMIQRTSRQEMMTVKEFAQTQKKAIKAGEKSLQYQWDVKPPTDEAENHVLSDMEKKTLGYKYGPRGLCTISQYMPSDVEDALVQNNPSHTG